MLEQPRSRAVTTRWTADLNAPTAYLEEWTESLPSDSELERREETHRVVDESEYLGWAEPILEPLESPPHSTRSGLCFEVESTEMREACTESIGAMLEADAVVHEVRHQQSAYHTDLVYADVDPDALADRDRMVVGREPLHDPLQRFKTWWYLYEFGPKAKREAIDDGLYSQPSKNRRHVNWLLEHGYVATSATGHLTAVVPPKIATLHAVELKLRDWEKALEQAARARRCDDKNGYGPLWAEYYDRYGYADYAWVALDAGAIDRALKHADRFREAGVGLLAVAEGGAVVKHIDADHQPRKRYTRDRAYVESQILERIDVDEHLPSDLPESHGSVQRTLGVVADGSGGDGR